MDPWTENAWLLQFRELARRRTSLLITHRFTTARHADIIHVVEEGRVIESGSHDELLLHNGQYAKCWREQMEMKPLSPVKLPI